MRLVGLIGGGFGYSMISIGHPMTILKGQGPSELGFQCFDRGQS